MGTRYAVAQRLAQLLSDPMAKISATALPENADLAFPGEPAWAPARLTEAQAQRLLETANPNGRPNADVLRRRLTVSDGEPQEYWQIDFPAHISAQEAALYEAPFARLKRFAPTWQNPFAQATLRRTLGRLSRFLAMPAKADAPDWRWIEDDVLPDENLVVVARDDDFTQGILHSLPFRLWQEQLAREFSPDRIVTSFPFPWAPATPLSALTATQEENRFAIARAARSGSLDTLDAAVLGAYGWTSDLSDQAILDALAALQAQRR